MTEAVSGFFKAQPIHSRGRWRSAKAVEHAAVQRVESFRHPMAERNFCAAMGKPASKGIEGSSRVKASPDKLDWTYPRARKAWELKNRCRRYWPQKSRRSRRIKAVQGRTSLDALAGTARCGPMLPSPTSGGHQKSRAGILSHVRLRIGPGGEQASCPSSGIFLCGWDRRYLHRPAAVPRATVLPTMA